MWEDEGDQAVSAEELFTVASLPYQKSSTVSDRDLGDHTVADISRAAGGAMLPGPASDKSDHSDSIPPTNAPSAEPDPRDAQDVSSKTPSSPPDSKSDFSQATLQYPTPQPLPHVDMSSVPEDGPREPLAGAGELGRTQPRRVETHRSISARDLSRGEAQRVADLWKGTYSPSSSPHMTIKNSGMGSDQATESVVVKTRIVREQGATSFERPDYTLLDKIGEGGVGIVYAARQTSINRTVALKMLRSHTAIDEDAREKFLAEAVVTGELDHPNIVPVYDLGTDEQGAHFYSMKRVEGTPWSMVIGKKSLSENLDILMKVADAVAFAHARGVVHRDLKPDNVMLGQFGEVLVMDWGIALSTSTFLRGEALTQSNSMGGTPAYMAPEMATGPLQLIGPRSDVYLLGALLFEILTGLTPHTGHDVLSCLKAAARNEIQVCDEEGELIDIAYKAMATDLNQRYQDVHGFQAAIRTYESHSESISLAARADEDLRTARETKDYQDFSRALFAYQEALALWSDNVRAAHGVEDAQLAYAATALSKGDYDLGLSLLDGRQSSHRTLRQKLLSAQKERDLRKARLRHLRWTAAGLVAGIVLVLSVALYFVLDAKSEADRINKDLEESQAKLADSYEELEKANEDLEGQKTQLTQALTSVGEEKRRADREAEEARRQETEARQQERRAREQERRAEQASYVAQIGLASAHLDENAFIEARRVIDHFANPERAHWRHWEWGRLSFLVNRAEHTVGAEARVQRIAWSPDGQFLLVATSGREARIWDAQQRRFLDVSVTLSAGAGALAISPDGQRIALAGGAEGTIQLWSLDALRHETAGGNSHREWKGHDKTVLSLRFSRDGKYLLSSSEDATARLWDVSPERDTERWVRQFSGHIGPIWDAVISHDNRRVFTAGEDRYVGIWDVEEGTRTARFSGHRGPVYALALAEDNSAGISRVLSAGNDRFIMGWDPDQVKEFDYGELGNRLQALERGERNNVGVGSAESTFQVRVFAGHTGEVRTLQVAPGGRYLASGGHDNTVRVWDLQSEVQQPTAHRILRGHGGWVRSLAYHPDGKHLVSGGYDQQLKFWDVENYFESLELARENEGPLLTVEYSTDGGRIIAAGQDGTASIWDARTGQKTQRLREGHEYLTTSAAFFPAHDRRIATSAGDGSTIIWRMDTGGALAHLTGTGPRSVVAVASDGRWMATGSDGNKVLLWPTDEGRAELEPIELEAHQKPITAAAFCPTSDDDVLLLYTGDDGGRGILWQCDRATRRWTVKHSLRSRRDRGETIRAAKFLPDGSRLLTASAAGIVSHWSIPDGMEITQDRLELPGAVSMLDITPDGKHVVIAYNTRDEREGTRRQRETTRLQREGTRLRYWSLDQAGRDAEVDYSMSGDLYSVAFDQAGEEVIFTSNDSRYQVGRWNPARGDLRPYWGGELPINIWNTLPVPGRTELLTVGGSAARLWDIQRRERIQSFGPHQGIKSAGFSPDGKRAVTAGMEGTLKLWDLDTGKVIVKFVPTTLPNGRAGEIHVAQYCPAPDRLRARVQGERAEDVLLTAGADSIARLWAIRGGHVEEIRQLKHPGDGPLQSATFSPNGQRIVTGAADGTAYVWDSQTGEIVASLEGDKKHQLAINHVAFSADGSLLVTGSDDNRTNLWKSGTWQFLLTLEGHTAAVTSISISPDNRRVVTSSRDGTAKLWDAENGDEVFTLKGHAEEVNGARFSPDGRQIVTVGADGRAVVWPAEDIPASLTLSPEAMVYIRDDQPEPIDVTAEFRAPIVRDYDGCRLHVYAERDTTSLVDSDESTEPIDPISETLLVLGHESADGGRYQLQVSSEDRRIWISYPWQANDQPRLVASWTEVAPNELEFEIHGSADRRALEALIRGLAYRADWDGEIPDARRVRIEFCEEANFDPTSTADDPREITASRQIQLQNPTTDDPRSDREDSDGEDLDGSDQSNESEQLEASSASSGSD